VSSQPWGGGHPGTIALAQWTNPSSLLLPWAAEEVLDCKGCWLYGRGYSASKVELHHSKTAAL
jgi:hypothetical protein